MPRRRVLTGAQLENLLALPATEDDLVRQWTLSGDDLAAVGRRRRNHNQLGFALQLCVLRYVQRHLVSAQTHRVLRTDAMATWRIAVAAP